MTTTLVECRFRALPDFFSTILILSQDMKNFEKTLSGGDLRSIGRGNSVVQKIRTRDDFDQFFKLLSHKDRLVVMRAADAIEKITRENKEYLFKHKKNILDLYKIAKDKELKWHLALLIPRLNLTIKELDNA